MLCFHSVLLGASVVGEAESWKRVVYAKCKGKGGKTSLSSGPCTQSKSHGLPELQHHSKLCQHYYHYYKYLLVLLPLLLVSPGAVFRHR